MVSPITVIGTGMASVVQPLSPCSAHTADARAGICNILPGPYSMVQVNDQ